MTTLVTLLWLLGATEGRNIVRVTPQGKVMGKVHHLPDGKKVENYFGIPYAKPPIGKLRYEVRF